MIKDTQLPANPIRFNRHPKRKNNDLVAAMYALYQTGKSMAFVGGVYGRTRQAIYDLFRSRHYQLRSKPLKGVTMVDGHRFCQYHNGYLRGTIKGRRINLHRYLWERDHGPVPETHVVRHKDRNKLNNDPANLELIPKKEMPKAFNPEHHNQFTIPNGNRMTHKKLVALKAEEAWHRASRFNVGAVE